MGRTERAIRLLDVQICCINMRLTYLYNSGFLLETGKVNILFDYYRKGQDIIRHLLASELPLYVLVSHSHADHFNPDCLGWRSKHRDVRYIFSDELSVAAIPKKNDITYLPVGGSYVDEYLAVEAFGSTDLGCSFYLAVDGISVFHAGDLNNWHWTDESMPEEAAAAECAYLNELRCIAEAHSSVHLAMFPVDARIGSDYARGARQFLQAVRTDIFVPMHFWNRPDKAAAFSATAHCFGARSFVLQRSGESIEI